MKNYTYHTCCVNSTAKKINDMVDRALEVTYRTFLSHVPLEELKSVFDWYEWERSDGLHLKNDYAVSWFRSVYDGRHCYYCCQSGIEYIWVKEA